MTKFGYVGTKDDADTVNVTAVQIITDVGELVARLSDLFLLSRSGNVIDVVDFASGLNQVVSSHWTASGDVSLVNSYCAVGGIACQLMCDSGAVNYSRIYRYLANPPNEAIGAEMWFAPVSNSQKVSLLLAVYTGALLYEAGVRYSFADGTLAIQQSGSPNWLTVDTPSLREQVGLYHKVKVIFNRSTGLYNRLLLNEHSYYIGDYTAKNAASSVASHMIVGAQLENVSGSDSYVNIGKVVTTQNEQLTSC
jgi:hypothetical protein